MKVLHFYHPQNELQSRYVSLLTESMGRNVESVALTTLPEVKSALSQQHFDILHIHGCWSVNYAKAAGKAQRMGTRTIITPHGELEPWILRNRQWQEKMPKTLLYQRQTIQEAYVVIAMGNMERESLQELKWNPRIETIRNAAITRSVTPDDMTRQLLKVYQKVMDSDVFHVMNDKTRHALFLLLRAATCGNAKWLKDPVPELSRDEWRQLCIYIRSEQLEAAFHRAVYVLGLRLPDIDVSQVEYYLPAGYRPLKTIAETIGNKFVSENDRLLATFKYLHKLHTSQRLTMAHMVELEREIREHDIDEEQLTETLGEARLLTFVQRLMGVLADFTQLEEGIMPVSAISDRQTEKIKDIITNHLTI